MDVTSSEKETEESLKDTETETVASIDEEELNAIDITKTTEVNVTPTDTPTPLVLDPDHPMMQRFQAALKNHLLKQLDRISNQVSELDEEIKKKEKEKEETGLQLYALQHELFKQQKTIEDCEVTIDTLMKERLSLDEIIVVTKTNWKEEINRLNCNKKKESELITEFHRLSSLEKQMEKWEQEMGSELAVSQRISEKTQFDKIKLIEEKRKMDMHLLRVMTEVSNYESEIRLLEGEIDLKQEEKDSLNQTLTDATADLQALISDQKRLMATWNSVISTINQRNGVYSTLSKELSTCQEAFRSLNSEIESYKRSGAEEMKKSEKLALILNRAENDNQSAETTLKNLLNKKAGLEDNITSVAAMIHRTEADFQRIKIDTEKIEGKVNSLRMALNKLRQDKRVFEDETMNLLHGQIADDKTAMHFNKLLRDIREKTREQEYHVLECENKISQKYLEAEKLKDIIARNNDIINEMNIELNTKEEELKKFDDEISKCHMAAIQKQGNYATLTRKIEKIMEKTGYGKPGQTPSELRIFELEKLNAEMQAKNDKLQSLWLLQQSNNVKVSQQRNEQLKDISLLRRQNLLAERSALKIDIEIEREKKTETNLNKSIHELQHKLSLLNETLIDKKGYKENLDKENTYIHAQFVQSLKNSEMEQIRLKEEIRELENGLEELAETMLDVQREMLAWEKKIKTAVDTKTSMQEERSSTGEVGQMKAEIHRMEIRYSQLKRVQEKLISDLELCIVRRDAILDGADAMERRQNQSINTRFNFQKKLDSLKNNIRHLRNERKQIEKIIANTEEGQNLLKKVIEEKEARLAEMEEKTKQMDLQLEDKKLHKCRNLEMLIRRQKKCKMYETLKSKKHRPLFRSEGSIENELQKAKNKNASLISMMESLIEDFPAYRFQLKKIYNTFRAEPS